MVKTTAVIRIKKKHPLQWGDAMKKNSQPKGWLFFLPQKLKNRCKMGFAAVEVKKLNDGNALD